MSAARLLCDLERRGIVLWRAGDTLHYRAPTGALTPALRTAISAYKPALVPLLPDTPPGSKESKGSKAPDDAPGPALLPLLSFLPGGIPETSTLSGCGVPDCLGARFLRDAAGGWWCDPHFRRGLLINAAAAVGYPPLAADPASGGPAAWREYAAHIHRLELTPETERLHALCREQASAHEDPAGPEPSGVARLVRAPHPNGNRLRPAGAT